MVAKLNTARAFGRANLAPASEANEPSSPKRRLFLAGLLAAVTTTPLLYGCAQEPEDPNLIYKPDFEGNIYAIEDMAIRISNRAADECKLNQMKEFDLEEAQGSGFTPRKLKERQDKIDKTVQEVKTATENFLLQYANFLRKEGFGTKRYRLAHEARTMLQNLFDEGYVISAQDMPKTIPSRTSAAIQYSQELINPDCTSTLKDIAGQAISKNDMILVNEDNPEYILFKLLESIHEQAKGKAPDDLRIIHHFRILNGAKIEVSLLDPQLRYRYVTFDGTELSAPIPAPHCAPRVNAPLTLTPES